MDYEKAYKDALERARNLMAMYPQDAPGYKEVFPELAESEKPLTPFQQCLNLILRKVYFASIPNTEGVDKFILDIVKNHTDELVELAKKHEYTDYQLSKSEDERIRNGLIDMFQRHPYCEINGLKTKDIVAWLEKQKEQKPVTDDLDQEVHRFFEECITVHDAKIYGVEERVIPVDCYEVTARHFAKWQKDQDSAEWSEDEEQMFGNILNHYSLIEAPTDGNGISKERYLAFIKSLRPVKTEWSEEDKKMIDTIVSVLGQYIDYKAVSGTGSGYATPRYSKEIDWLKSLRPSWKPSEEQLNALNFAITYFMHETNYKNPTELRDLYDELLKLK